ncbi:hypothetical protein HU200_044255 [Digitaria exilis]|uniref:Uncharacterized protein n=1 Tax=Digitaria exilis TaxID=1010633 RepID=A0A835B1S0_9POAL|nr:hypothetical protein HU200_044255 [Digitaria exilis]
MWLAISEVIEIDCGRNFESIGNMWLSKRFIVDNMFTSAALWGLWKLRNSLCFQNGRWKDVPNMLQRILSTILQWKLLCPEAKRQEFEQKADKMRSLVKRPGRLEN